MLRVPAFLAAAVIAAAAPVGVEAAAAQPGPAPAAAATSPPDSTTPGEAVATSPPAPRPAPPAPIKPIVAEPVAVTPLAAPDAFSTPAHDTGLPANLWRGSSLQVVQAVLPRLAEKPLPPVAAALARRVLATGAQGPAGAGRDPGLISARAAALMEQGDPKGAAAILARAPGLDRDPQLARVAAEGALLAGEDARACRIEEALGSGRDDIYWLRLRAYCQALAGKTAEAQLSFDLANSQARDVVFSRLMAAKLSGAKPGAASLRNGLDYALSRSLGLDLSKAKASPAVAAAVSPSDPGEPSFDVAALPPDIARFGQAIASGGPLRQDEFMASLDDAPKTAKRGARVDEALLLLAAYERWSPVAGSPATHEGRAPVLRDIGLDSAAVRKRIGETALLALWNCADAGPAGLALADRARIIWALREVGLDADARAFALEGLLSLK